jgi:hypothetical protein
MGNNKNKPDLSVIDDGVYDVAFKSTPPPKHQGYSPVLRGKILGRYRHYEVAASKAMGGIVMLYEDACVRTGTKFEYCARA